MKKIVPFKHDINFKNNLAEIVSISLDHELKLVDRVVKGGLTISGSYKMNDISINTEEFDFNIPVNIEMSNKYLLDDLEISIENFYYEIVDNKILSINIEIALDNIEEQIIEKEPILEPASDFVLEPKYRNNEEIDILSELEDSEIYSTYQICIVKENDTLESILLKYNITKETLELYNDINEIKIGDKLVIPSDEKD